MRILILSLLLTGCASNWADYNYGPADWLNDNTSLTIDTMYNYAHLVEPTIQIHRVASVTSYCGTIWARGCAYLNGDRCDIYVGEMASPDTISHEERHCRGWVHYRPQFELFMTMGTDFSSREIARSKQWMPMDHIGSTSVAMTQGYNE
jgi:hypothetical protein